MKLHIYILTFVFIVLLYYMLTVLFSVGFLIWVYVP